MKKLKDPPLMFPLPEGEPIDVTYPLQKEQLRVRTIYPPQGKQSFYGIRN